MTANGWIQFLLFFAVLVVLMRPLGIYMARVFDGQRTFVDPVLKPVERLLYRLCGVKADAEMDWREYASAMLLFSLVSLVLTYVIERVQLHLPWNPQGLAGVPPALAWKTLPKELRRVCSMRSPDSIATSARIGVFALKRKSAFQGWLSRKHEPILCRFADLAAFFPEP